MNFSVLPSWSLAGTRLFEMVERGTQPIGPGSGSASGCSKEWPPRQANGQYRSGDE